LEGGESPNTESIFYRHSLLKVVILLNVDIGSRINILRKDPIINKSFYYSLYYKRRKQMAHTAYLKLAIDGNDIEGSSRVQSMDREGTIPLIAVNHGVRIPTNPVGVPTGRCKHGRLVITKRIDKTTPLIMKAQVNNEEITRFELRLYKPKDGGGEEQFYTIELMNAQIVRNQFEMLSGDFPENQDSIEHVSFSYQSVIWRSEESGFETHDTVGGRI